MSDFKHMDNFIISRLVMVAFLACMNTGLYLVAVKFRIIDFYNAHRKHWMPSCTFCLFFWMAFIEVTLMIIQWWILSVEGALIAFALSVAAAAVSRRLV